MSHAKGSILDAGATIAAHEHISGRKLELLAGKHSPLIMQVALEELALPADRCMMVGDRLETGILMGRQAGMKTAAVLTGVATREAGEKLAHPPTFIVDNIGSTLALAA